MIQEDSYGRGLQWNTLARWLEGNYHILDYGCGDGRWTKALADYGLRVHAVDFGLTHKWQGNAFFEPLETAKLEQYDAIVCLDVFEHVTRPDLGLFLLATHSNHLIVSVPNGHGIYEWLIWIQSLWNWNRPKYPHLHFKTRQEWRELFRDGGWAIEEEMPRSLICGPIVDVLMPHWFYPINNWLGRRFSKHASAWMFNLRKA